MNTTAYAAAVLTLTLGASAVNSASTSHWICRDTNRLGIPYGEYILKATGDKQDGTGSITFDGNTINTHYTPPAPYESSQAKNQNQSLLEEAEHLLGLNRGPHRWDWGFHALVIRSDGNGIHIDKKNKAWTPRFKCVEQ